MTKDEDNADVFFASIFESKSTSVWPSRPLRWKTETGSRIKPPWNRRKGLETATWLSHSQIYGDRWNMPKDTEGAGKSTHWATFKPSQWFYELNEREKISSWVILNTFYAHNQKLSVSCSVVGFFFFFFRRL